MPLYREWVIDNNSLAAIWKIEEPESFFAERTGVVATMANEKKRKEHLAGRFLLTHLKHDFPLWNIRPDIHDKPRIDHNEYYFSISHSYPYVAAVINSHREAGIDIQTWHPRINRIQHKFLSASEQELFGNDPAMLIVAWCAKEAAYKWQGRRGVDFITHLPIASVDAQEGNGTLNIYTTLLPPPQMVTVDYLVADDFACAYVTDAVDWVIY